MTFEKGNIGYFLAFMLLGGILGSSLGTLLSKLFPVISIIKMNLTGPLSINLEIISFALKLNLAAILGIVAGIFIFKKV